MDIAPQPVAAENSELTAEPAVETIPQPNGRGALLAGGLPGNKGGSGRPPKSFVLRCQYLADLALQTVEAAEILKDRADPLFMETAKWVAERGYGKAPQPITGPDNAPLIPAGRLSSEEVKLHVNRLLASNGHGG